MFYIHLKKRPSYIHFSHKISELFFYWRTTQIQEKLISLGISNSFFLQAVCFFLGFFAQFNVSLHLWAVYRFQCSTTPNSIFIIFFKVGRFLCEKRLQTAEIVNFFSNFLGTYEIKLYEKNYHSVSLCEVFCKLWHLIEQVDKNSPIFFVQIYTGCCTKNEKWNILKENEL